MGKVVNACSTSVAQAKAAKAAADAALEAALAAEELEDFEDEGDDLVEEEDTLQVTVRNGVVHFQEGTVNSYTKGNRPNASSGVKAKINAEIADGEGVATSLAGTTRRYLTLERISSTEAMTPGGSTLKVPSLV